MDIHCNDLAHFERTRGFMPKKVHNKSQRKFCKTLSLAEDEVQQLHTDHLKRRHKLWFKDANTDDTERTLEQCEAHWTKTAQAIAAVNERIRAAYRAHLVERAQVPVLRMVLHPFTSDVQFHDAKPVRDWMLTKSALIVKGRSYTLPYQEAALRYANDKYFGFTQQRGAFGLGGHSVVCKTAVVNRDSGAIVAKVKHDRQALFALGEDGQLTPATVEKTLLNGYYPERLVSAWSAFIRMTCGGKELRIYNPSTGKLVVIDFASHGKVGECEVHLKWFCAPVNGRLHLRVGTRLHLSIAYNQLY